MFRNPPRRTVSQLRAAIRMTEARIAQLEAEGSDPWNERHHLRLVLQPELERAERRETAAETQTVGAS